MLRARPQAADELRASLRRRNENQDRTARNQWRHGRCETARRQARSPPVPGCPGSPFCALRRSRDGHRTAAPACAHRATAPGDPKTHRPAPVGAARPAAPSDRTETVSVRPPARRASRNIRRSPASRRSPCRHRAPASEFSTADCPSSARHAASRSPLQCGRTQCARRCPRSCATIMTLRTNGERGDQCSFMRTP